MTAISWKSAQSGSWTDPNDWTPGQVPGPGDDTTIGVSGSYTVSLSSATPTTVDSLTIGDANATFGIDAQQFSPGGTSLTVTGTLTNAGIINLGRSGLPASDTLSVRALSNTGTINLIGGSTGTADLLIGSAAPSTLTGSLSLSADALVEYESGGITTIGSGASLTLIGANAWVADASNPASNSALTGLSSNLGSLYVENGAAIAPDSGIDFTNSGYFDLEGGAVIGGANNWVDYTNASTARWDIDAGEFSLGGTILTLSGALTNNGVINFGRSGLPDSDTLSVAALANAGRSR